MKSNLRKQDLARGRYNSFSLEDVVNNNISLQSVERSLARDFNISINNINASYFLSNKFKSEFSTYSEDKKKRICLLLASSRRGELLKKLEE